MEAVGDAAITVYYKDSQGALSEQILFRSDEARLDLAAEGKPWAFDAPGAEFKLGLEAYRISQAALFDPMMAVHTSNVEPLPHQISAVYEALLAILPGVTLTELWQMMAVMENTLRLISALVLLASLLGLAAMLPASIRNAVLKKTAVVIYLYCDNHSNRGCPT